MRWRYTALCLALAVLAAMHVTAFERIPGFQLRPTMPIVVLFNPQNNDISPDAAESALQVGLNAWNNVSGSRVEFVYGGRVTDTQVANDGRNVVIFRDASPPDVFFLDQPATTYTWLNSEDAVIETDTVLWDGAYTYFTGASGCTGTSGVYLEDVMAHEFGHWLALDDSFGTQPTMQAFRQATGFTPCTQFRRTLANDDIAAVRGLYPTGPNSAPTLTITSPADGATFLPGSNITFSASAFDQQEGEISPRVQWVSSVMGDFTPADASGFPTGPRSPFVRPLTPGVHVITVSVRDAGGLTTTATITVTVANPTPPAGSTNVALASAGAVASASSFYSTDFSPAFANDGNRAGPQFWNDATADTFPDSLQIDFAGTYTIGQVNVFTVQDNFRNPVEPTATTPAFAYAARNFSVEYWTGSSWAPIPGASVTTNTLAWTAFAFDPITTQKIRVVVTVGANSYSRLTEVEAFTTGSSSPPPPPPPTSSNVAAASAGATVAASSFYSGDFGPDSIIDGNRAGPAFWNDATFNSFPDTVQIDFAGTFTIGQVNVFSVQDNYTNPSAPSPTQIFRYFGVTDFSVEYWTGTGWAPIPGASVSGNSLVWRLISFTPVTTQRIRLVITGTADGYSRLTEVEALTVGDGPPPPPPPPPPASTNVAAAAAGAVVNASSFYSTDFGPESVIDGNRAGPAFWNDATLNEFPDTLEIDFAATYTIGQVNVFSVQDNYSNPSPPTATQTFTNYGVRDFRIEYWTGTTWTPIPGATISNNSLVWRPITFTPVTTDRIRVVIIRAADEWSRLTEVEALTAGS